MKCATYSLNNRGAMAELVDALVLGTNFFGSEGSSPFRPTKDDYATVYDIAYSSTIKKKKGVVQKENLRDVGLRNQYFRM